MKLDRTTYEAWLLDRIEGNLTPAQERELEAFLGANPDLNADIGGLPAVDDGTPAPIDWKNELKKRLPPTGLPDAARLNEFLVARMEGDLEKAQESALDKFLYEHPEQEQLAKRMAASKASAEHVPFAHKATIARHFPPQGLPDTHRLTDFLIAAKEGDLSPEQQQALKAFVAAHPEARRDERLVAVARVAPERIVFAGKQGLKKREVRVIVLWQRYAVAASIALLLGFAWWVMRGEKNDAPAFAEKEKPHVQPKEATPLPGTVPAPQGPEAETLRKIGGPESPSRSYGGQGTETQGENAGAPRGKDGDAARKNERKAQPVPSATPIIPEPEPQFVESPMRVQQEPAPALAQDPVPTQKEEGPGTSAAVQTEQPAMAALERPSPGGTPIGTVLANTVRSGVLETGERTNGLDREDALAMVNKGLGAITGGEGGVEVQHKTTRDRWKVRLGKNLAISASTGR